MFLNTTPQLFQISDNVYSLVFEDSIGGLIEGVKIPECLDHKLNYLAVISGAIRGAFEMVQVQVDCWWEEEILKGMPRNDLRIKFIRIIEEELPPGE